MHALEKGFILLLFDNRLILQGEEESTICDQCHEPIQAIGLYLTIQCCFLGCRAIRQLASKPSWLAGHARWHALVIQTRPFANFGAVSGKKTVAATRFSSSSVLLVRTIVLPVSYDNIPSTMLAITRQAFSHNSRTFFTGFSYTIFICWLIHSQKNQHQYRSYGAVSTGCRSWYRLAGTKWPSPRKCEKKSDEPLGAVAKLEQIEGVCTCLVGA